MNPMNPRLYDASLNRHPPCLYMLWPRRLDIVQVPSLPPNYKLRTYRDSDDRALFELLESDGEVMDHRAWQAYRDTLLPNGLFVIEDDVESLVEGNRKRRRVEVGVDLSFRDMVQILSDPYGRKVSRQKSSSGRQSEGRPSIQCVEGCLMTLPLRTSPDNARKKDQSSKGVQVLVV